MLDFSGGTAWARLVQDTHWVVKYGWYRSSQHLFGDLLTKYNRTFCIEMPRTGTTSPGKAFEILGLSHKEWENVLHKRGKEGDFETLLAAAADYDSFDGLPWAADGLLNHCINSEEF